jgi:hypothetical protein
MGGTVHAVHIANPAPAISVSNLSTHTRTRTQWPLYNINIFSQVPTVHHGSMHGMAKDDGYDDVEVCLFPWIIVILLYLIWLIFAVRGNRRGEGCYCTAIHASVYSSVRC